MWFFFLACQSIAQSMTFLIVIAFSKFCPQVLLKFCQNCMKIIGHLYSEIACLLYALKTKWNGFVRRRNLWRQEIASLNVVDKPFHAVYDYIHVLFFSENDLQNIFFFRTCTMIAHSLSTSTFMSKILHKNRRFFHSKSTLIYMYLVSNVFPKCVVQHFVFLLCRSRYFFNKFHHTCPNIFADARLLFTKCISRLFL